MRSKMCKKLYLSCGIRSVWRVLVRVSGLQRFFQLWVTRDDWKLIRPEKVKKSFTLSAKYWLTDKLVALQLIYTKGNWICRKRRHNTKRIWICLINHDCPPSCCIEFQFPVSIHELSGSLMCSVASSYVSRNLGLSIDVFYARSSATKQSKWLPGDTSFLEVDVNHFGV